MIEYKTERVSPESEESAIRILSCFGWELFNAQETYSENTRVVGATTRVRGGLGDSGFVRGFADGFHFGNSAVDAETQVQSVKEITNYVTLRFYRDTEMPNYQKIVKIENEYNLKANIWEEPKFPIKRLIVLIIGILVTIGGLWIMFSSGDTFDPEDIILLLFYLFMIPFTVIGLISYGSKKKRYEEIGRQMYGLLNQAKKLTQK